MNLDPNSTSFWVLGAIWFTVPILSWGWSLTTLYLYRNLKKIITEATITLEQTKKLNEEMVQYRLETVEMKTKVEEEIQFAAKYYSKISDLVTKQTSSPSYKQSPKEEMPEILI
jgi:hypothetical protein